MKYYDSYLIKSILGFVFLILSSILGLFVFHQAGMSFDLYWASIILIPSWLLSSFYFYKSMFIPRLQIFRTEIIIFGFKRKVISLDNIKELSLNTDFVFISFKENYEIKKVSFSILKTSKLNRLYVFNGKFQNY